MKSCLLFVFFLSLFGTLQSGHATVVCSDLPGKSLSSDALGGAHLLFAGQYGGSITKKKLEGQTTLPVDGCARGARVFEYTLQVTKSGKVQTYKGNADTLTSEMQASLKALAPGDSFQFSGIKAYLNGTKEVVQVKSAKYVIS